MNQALATKYELYLSRRKFTFLCKIQSSTFDPDSQKWNDKSISYGDKKLNVHQKSIFHRSVQDFVNKLDIGEIHTIPGYCGAFRTITALTTMVIDLHLRSE